MAKEIEEFNKIKNEAESKNIYIEKTMYFSIFMIIYKRIKIIRDSLKKSLEMKSILIQELLYGKKYFLRFTEMMNILYNFLKDNKLDIFYDVRCTSFLKINSFICKTFKILYKEDNFKRYIKINEEDKEIISNFFTQFFFLLSKLLLNNEAQFDYHYKISKNRKGFYFEEFKKNFENYFGNENYKMMVDFLNILLKSFKRFCKDNDTLKEDDVDDNSIEIDQRDSCPICLDYTDENCVHLKDCNHIYHLECLKLQIKKNLTNCSLCKKPITGIKEDPNFKVNPNNVFNNTEHSSIFGERNNSNIFVNHSLFSENSPTIFNNSLFNNTGNSSISLFGNNSSSNGGLFGNNNRGSSLFGNNSTGYSLFRNTGTISLFSSTNNTSNSIFGRANNNSNFGLFGNSTNNNSQQGGLFGNTRTNNSQQGGLFGNARTNNSQGGGLFGNSIRNNTPPRGGLFGNTNGSLFGNNTNNSLFN